MGVYEAMRAAGYAAGVMFSAALDSTRPRDQHRDYDRALRRAEDALVDAEAERDVLEPAELGSCSRQKCDWHNPGWKADREITLEDEAWDANEEFDARREERTNTWMRDTVSPVEGSGDATGGVPSPPSVVPLSELVDRVADELRAQHQPNWLGDKVRATALILKEQGL